MPPHSDDLTLGVAGSSQTLRTSGVPEHVGKEVDAVADPDDLATHHWPDPIGKHVGGIESGYRFETPEQLIEDFKTAVQAARRKIDEEGK